MFWEKWADRLADLWIDLSDYKESEAGKDD